MPVGMLPDAVIPVESVEDRPNSYRVVRKDTSDVLFLSKKHVKFFPGMAVIPGWYAKILKIGTTDVRK